MVAAKSVLENLLYAVKKLRVFWKLGGGLVQSAHYLRNSLLRRGSWSAEPCGGPSPVVRVIPFRPATVLTLHEQFVRRLALASHFRSILLHFGLKLGRQHCHSLCNG